MRVCILCALLGGFAAEDVKVAAMSVQKQIHLGPFLERHNPFQQRLAVTLLKIPMICLQT